MIRKVLIALVIAVLGYQAVGRARDALAMRYFHQQCEKYGGEFIYRTVDNVEGVFQMRPRDPRDYFDRLRKGDIPEDPYGHTNWEAQEPQTMFINHPFTSYKFFEDWNPDQGRGARDAYRRFSGLTYEPGNPKPLIPMKVEIVSTLMSRYGFRWREERSASDRRYGVRKGVLEVVEINSQEVLAARVGFFIQTPSRKRMDICPKGKDDNITLQFVSKVLRQPKR